LVKSLWGDQKSVKQSNGSKNVHSGAVLATETTDYRKGASNLRLARKMRVPSTIATHDDGDGGR
jgi:hypothetical protein